MIAPVKNPVITSPYGWRTLWGKREFHDGLDFVSATKDAEVLAIAPGNCVFDMDNYQEALRWIDNKHSGGNYCIILHEIDKKRYYVRYLHLSENKVRVGQYFAEGDVIGTYANVGKSTGPHLHFDMYTHPAWEKIDPTPILQSVL